MTWAPVECTLPLDERPERVAAFDELFAFTLGRTDEGALLLEVRVADRHTGTLDALASRAAMVMGDSSV